MSPFIRTLKDMMYIFNPSKNYISIGGKTIIVIVCLIYCKCNDYNCIIDIYGNVYYFLMIYHEDFNWPTKQQIHEDFLL